jgi:DNA mismatch repair protein MutS
MATEMADQYNKLKSKYKDAILLFRLGDFYEAFDEDAKIISKVLSITLTARGKNENRRPMAGIPFHALDNYLPKLIEANYKVAIAEQLTPPNSKQIVERDVVKVFTKGTYTNEKILENNSNHFISCLYVSKKNKDNIFYVAFLDITTGEFFVLEYTNFQNVKDIVSNFKPKELLLSHSYKNIDFNFSNTYIQFLWDDDFEVNKCTQILKDHFKTANLKGFGFDDGDFSIVPLGVLFRYAKESHKTNLSHITSVQKRKLDQTMFLDRATISSLEIMPTSSQLHENISLFDVLCKCATHMAARLLKNWILQPLIDAHMINKRLECVDFFFQNIDLVKEIQVLLNEIFDLERLCSKIGTESINPRDMLCLATSLKQIQKIYMLLCKNSTAFENLEKIKIAINPDKFQPVVKIITSTISIDCPVKFEDGGIIKAGYNSQLDELRELESTSSQYLANLQIRERKKTGIESLKVKFNKIFGYYIEVTKSNLTKIPPDYIRKQTLANAERYITPELKEYEDKILTAQEKILALEVRIFREVVAQVQDYINIIQKAAQAIANLDIYLNFAVLSKQRNYTRPQISATGSNKLPQSRHPVIELVLKENYIANDVNFDENTRLQILTGPNMSGKSTYIRQVAICYLMMQIGCFVPAKNPSMQIVDRIFTRVGARDNIVAGESTFMVEMNEAANILNNATDKSLIILDEVGRGTSTYDGVSIAWAIVEYIHKKIKAKTLFATHYHELINLETLFDGIANIHVHVYEKNDQIVFTHKIKTGGMSKSYGIHVAQMAGIPKQVTNRAEQILNKFEKGQTKSKDPKQPATLQISLIQ